MRTRTVVFAIWACFVVRAGFYSAVTPLWEGFDEFSHFSVIQYLATNGKLPDPRFANSSEQVLESLRLVPVSREVVRFTDGLITHDAYWKLSLPERQDRERRLRELPRVLADQPPSSPLRLYESQQAPLYYWLMTPVYLMVRGLEFPTQIWLRFATVLLSSLVIPIAYLVFRRVLGQEPLAIAATLILAMIPQLMFMVQRVSNESLAIVAGSLYCLVAFRLMDVEPNVRRGMQFGLVLAVALLTKAYFLSLVPVAAILLVWIAVRDPINRNRAVRQMVAAAAVCAVVAGWWYVRTVMVSGSVTGEQSIGASMAAKIRLWDAVKITPWRRILDFLAISYIWIGNWSFVELRSWMYGVIEILLLPAAIGTILQLSRRRQDLACSARLWFAGLPCACLFVGLCYHAALSWASFRGGSLGFYLYALVVAEIILLVTGLARLVPARWMLAPFPVVALIFVAVEAFGNWFLLLPYYTGVTAHTVSGALPAAAIAQLREIGMQQFFANLAVNKPGYLTPAVLMALTAMHAAATAILMGWTLRLKPLEIPLPASRAADPGTPGQPG